MYREYKRKQEKTKVKPVFCFFCLCMKGIRQIINEILQKQNNHENKKKYCQTNENTEENIAKIILK